jgi:Na+/melibiose symporter-like transporter
MSSVNFIKITKVLLVFIIIYILSIYITDYSNYQASENTTLSTSKLLNLLYIVLSSLFIILSFILVKLFKCKE